MLERTIIYVDTSYLLASFYNTWATGARAQLEIDLPEVVNVLECRAVNQLNQPVHRQNWYDGIDSPHRYQRARAPAPVSNFEPDNSSSGATDAPRRRSTRWSPTWCSAPPTAGHHIILVPATPTCSRRRGIRGLRGTRDLYGFGWDSMSSTCATPAIHHP